MKRSNWLLPAALAGVTLLGLYVAAYYALVTRYDWVPNLKLSDTSVSLSPVYRWGGSVSQTVFYPIHQIDRRVRRSTWNPTIEEWQHSNPPPW